MDVFGILRGVALGVGVFAIVLAMVALMLAELHTQIVDIAGASSTAANVTNDSLDAIADLSGWLGLIVLVIVFGLLISLLLVAFAWKTAGSSA